MMPDNVLSTLAYHAAWLDVSRGPVEYLADYERAGVALYDGTQGMNVKIWAGRVRKEADLIDPDIFYYHVEVSAAGVPWTLMFTRTTEIKEIAIAFDNNMFPFVTFTEEGGNAFIWWYDNTDSAQKFTSLPVGTITPRCCIDEHRPSEGAVTDIVVAYLIAGSLYVRYQREHYATQHLMKAGLGANARLVEIGMNRHYRLQFWMRNANAVDGAAVFANPFLGDIVSDLCRKAGIPAENINVDELYNDNVIGFKCNSDDGVNKRLDALREMFFFDKSESEKRIFFPKRGREVTARIPYNSLVADDPSALNAVRVQESELPKTVTVNHLDPAGGFAKNKQTARRKSNRIKALKEQKVDSEVVLTADQGMTAATVKLKINWHELATFKFATTIEYSYVIPADVVEVEDKKGIWHRIRVTERNDEGVIIKFEGRQDAGQDVYATLGVGQSLPPPVSTTPGLIGETLLEIINGPVLRDQDDELGVMIGVCGTTSAWYGSQILISANNEASYFEAMQVETPATIGVTLDDLELDEGLEYPANQSVEVLVNFPLESVSYESLLNNANRCVIGDEYAQFQFAVLLGMVGLKYHYRLSGLVRGRYATDVEFWPTGTRFVLFDSSIVFLRAEQWMLGKEIFVKPVSLGLTEDETVPTGYDFIEGVSQREFPVSNVQASRDVSNNVTVTFIGAGRLGIGTAPRNGKYFAGYRIKFSDGHIIDTLSMTGTYSSAPGGVTVQVCALNTVTGEGPYSLATAT